MDNSNANASNPYGVAELLDKRNGSLHRIGTPFAVYFDACVSVLSKLGFSVKGLTENNIKVFMRMCELTRSNQNQRGS